MSPKSVISHNASVNPLKMYRKRLGLTIDQLCYQARVSRSLVIKNEHGAYPVPSLTLIRFYQKRVPNFSKEALLVDYRDWQRHQRTANFGLLTPHFPLGDYLKELPRGVLPGQRDAAGHTPVGTNDNEPVPHPFEYWRLASYNQPNLNQISKAFCIHQGLLFKFEQQFHLVNSVPIPIASALIEAGYDQSSLAGLELAFNEFKQYMRNLSLRVQEDGFIRRADSTT
ncbi:MAG TPA: helix-turn-helix transcriptional regulator [Patescibacteria group bacterium]|nr:helix-turn-helix transcriptional regulator [Patescibacteria group bacterium]